MWGKQNKEMKCSRRKQTQTPLVSPAATLMADPAEVLTSRIHACAHQPNQCNGTHGPSPSVFWI